MKLINLENNLVNISVILFYLIPVALITGPFIPDLFLVIIIINFLLIIFIKKDFSLIKK